MVSILLALFVQRLNLANIIPRPEAGRSFSRLGYDVASILLVQRLDCLADDIHPSDVAHMCAFFLIHWSDEYILGFISSSA